MKSHRILMQLAIMTAMLMSSVAAAAENSFYKATGVFSTRPSETASLQTIARFGPVGMGIDLIQPAFTMQIHNIEEGSPAAATGQLKAGQIIETINGQTLADIDPRIQLGQIVAAAEATDGLLKLMVKETVDAKAEQVIVKIPVLGAYSDTWPLNCPKSEKIVRNFADYLAKPGTSPGFGSIGMLFLLSTGEEKDLDVVRRWAKGIAERGAPTYAWYLGYRGIPLCEYYLRTGDQSVLPAIQQWVDSATKAEFFGGWAGRGGVPHVTYGGGGGHLNAGGTAVVSFLMLAKECGANVKDDTLHRVLTHFYRFAGRGNNPYGNGRPEGSFVDNGKNGNLAFAMAAAASLTPDGEKSIYAAARDAAAMTSFYTTTYMLHGHTGGGIGEIWRSAAMGLLHQKKPLQYREFMDNRQWHYDLSRRFDGSFGILGGRRYDNTEWGAGYALGYTIPRKTLRVTGAPPSKFSKKYQLPERPWGTAADDAFVSIEAAADKDGKRQDLSKETFANGSGKSVVERLTPTGLGDELIRRYAHHPDPIIRTLATLKTVGITGKYMGVVGANDKMRPELLLELLKSNDARVRRSGLDACRADKSGKARTPAVFALAIGMLKNPAESWWVKDAALNLVGRAPADWVAPHVDVLLPYLQHEEWWLQNAALTALTPVVADERCYRKVLPAIGEMLATCPLWNATAPIRRGALAANLQGASPDIQQLAAEEFKGAYTGFTGVKIAPGGQDITTVYDSQVKLLAGTLADVPGGYDVLYEIARQRHPDKILPYKEIFLAADSSQFGPELKKAIKPIIMDALIPEFVGKNRKNLLALAAAEMQSARPGGSRDAVNGLASLYARAGQGEFGWHMFKDLRNAEWSYHSFDPIPAEQVPWDQLVTRYREVTLPVGMENWFASDFDPAKAAWKTGKSPFGQYEGKIPSQPISKCSAGCVGPGCYGATKVNTLWEKEVLLMRGTFKVPPLKDGHRYRLRVNDGEHVGVGGGHLIYINGKPLIEVKKGNGRNSGGLPKGAYITKEFLDDFKSGEVTIAVKTFIRYSDKRVKSKDRTPQGKISIHLDEQKLPPMGDDLVSKSATVVPMLSSEWQAKQNPEDRELSASAAKFRYDGKFVANAKVLGEWTTVDVVQNIDEFTADKKTDARRARLARIKAMSFKDQGRTGDMQWIWSGDMLMDLDRYQALKMTPKTVGGVDYLFVEAGGFSTRNKPGWQSPLYVMKRQAK